MPNQASTAQVGTFYGRIEQYPFVDVQFHEFEAPPEPKQAVPLMVKPASEYDAGLSAWFRPLISKGAFVAGGCFKQFLTNATPRDVDIWFATQEDFFSMCDRLDDNSKYVRSYSTDRSVGYKHTVHDITLDLVRMRFGTPSEILTSFDFTVCQMAYYLNDAGEPTIAYHPRFSSDLQNKLLYMDEVSERFITPDAVFNRMIKYVKDYGYTPTHELKIWMFTTLASMKCSPSVSPVNSLNTY